MYPPKWAQFAAVLLFLGFNFTFFPQYLLGVEGMPRRYYEYAPEFQTLHVLSSAGAVILAIGYLPPPVYLSWSLTRGRRASANPWQAPGLGWTVASPPPVENFVVPPVVAHEPQPH